MCVFKHQRKKITALYIFPLFYGFYWYTTLFRLGSSISQANFFCICVYIDAIQTMIFHFPCQFPSCISHIMNLFKQKSSSLGTFLSHLFLLCAILPILISKQHCNIIYCYSLIFLSCFYKFRVREVVLRKYMGLLIDSQKGISYSNVSKRIPINFLEKWGLSNDYTLYL